MGLQSEYPDENPDKLSAQLQHSLGLIARLEGKLYSALMEISALTAALAAAEKGLVALESAGEAFDEALREDDPQQQLEDTDEAITEDRVARELCMSALALIRAQQPQGEGKEDEWSKEDHMPVIDGRGFRCPCGCNVFRKKGSLYRCNACEDVFTVA